MSFTVPIAPNGVAHWTQRTALDGRDYQLTLDWSQREGKWRLDLADQDGVAIRSGIALVVNWQLLAGVTDTRRPPGELVLVDTMGRAEDPGFADLGSRFVLLYFAAAELI